MDQPSQFERFRAPAAVDERRAAAFDTAEAAFARFLKGFSPAMGAYLGSALDVGEVTAERATRQDALSTFTDSCVTVLDLAPVRDTAYLVFSAEFAAWAADVLMGAPATLAGSHRGGFSDLDRRVLHGIVGAAAAELKKAWLPVIRAAAFARVEAEPHSAGPTRNTDEVFVHTARLQGAEGASVSAIMPARVVREGLAARQSEEATEGDADRRLSAALESAIVDVQAVLKGSNMQFRDLLRLRPGALFAMPQQAGSPLECQVNGVTKFTGEMIRDGHGPALLIHCVPTALRSEESQSER